MTSDFLNRDLHQRQEKKKFIVTSSDPSNKLLRMPYQEQKQLIPHNNLDKITILDLETPPSSKEDQNLLLPPWGQSNGHIMYCDTPSTPGMYSPYATITSRCSRPPISPGGSGSSSSGRRNRTFRPGTTRAKYRKRAILKNGECNIVQSKISQKSIRYLQDAFTTFVDAQWRWTLLTFGLSFILSWLFFAMIWWLIAFTHGDFEPEHLPDDQTTSGWKPCVYNIHSFTSCFLFSIETQHTIGYGVRTTTEECPEAIFIMCFQSIYGVMIQAFMVGIVFAKMTRPKNRTQTLLFSRYAVICQRDGELTLMFRVGDMRKSHIIGANIRAQLIKTKTTKEGEVMSQYTTELDIGTDGCSSNMFFIWPLVVCHKINESSPLFNMSASDLIQQERFEIVVILEGTVESTGQTAQARSSFLASEILWGHRFEPVVTYNKEKQGYEIDYSKFDATVHIDTPLCSARELADYYKLQDDIKSSAPVDVKFSIGPKQEYA